MFHLKVGRKGMKKESEKGTFLFEKFRYHVMHNQLDEIGLKKSEDFCLRSNLEYLAILTSDGRF